MLQLVRTGRREGNKLGSAVIRILPADYQTLLYQLRDLPAKDRSTHPKSLREPSGPALPLSDEPKHKVKGSAGCFAMQSHGSDATHCALEVEYLVHETRCRFRS